MDRLHSLGVNQAAKCGQNLRLAHLQRDAATRAVADALGLPAAAARRGRQQGPVLRRQARLTELLVDKIVVVPHPHKIDKEGRRHYLIRAIPYQDPQQETERLKAVHEARVKIIPRV